jgi:hypothetical protein
VRKTKYDCPKRSAFRIFDHGPGNCYHQIRCGVVLKLSLCCLYHSASEDTASTASCSLGPSLISRDIVADLIAVPCWASSDTDSILGYTINCRFYSFTHFNRTHLVLDRIAIRCFSHSSGDKSGILNLVVFPYRREDLIYFLAKLPPISRSVKRGYLTSLYSSH